MSEPILTPEDEVEIREVMIRQEAARRLRTERLAEKIGDFMFEFPPGTPESHAHEFSTEQVARLIEDLTGESIFESELDSILKMKGYKKQVLKDEYPVKIVWIFG